MEGAGAPSTIFTEEAMLKENDPRGTLDELEPMGVDLAQVPSCARRVIEDNQVVVLGCREWKRCELAEKGAGGRGESLKGGPVTKVVQILKKKYDGKTVVSTGQYYCFHIPGLKRRIEETGGLLRIIGSEARNGGEQGKFKTRGSEREEKTIPGQGWVSIVHDKILEEKINPFPRPGTEGNLTEQLLVKEVMDAERERIARDRPGELLGLKVDPDFVTPPGETT